MEKMLTDYSKEAASLCNNVIEPRYSRACVTVQSRMSQLPSLEMPLARWEPVTGRWVEEHEIDLLCVRRMSELAKRIEESASSSSVWRRLGGEELSGLRVNFRNLLRQLLDGIDAGATARCQEYETICRSAKDGDIILAFRFANLLSAAVALSHASAATRIEVGFSAGGTEFSCFLAERSAGVTIRRSDNLFALCTNGEWRSGFTKGAPSLASIRQVVEKFGGQLASSSMDGTAVKVSFTV